MAQEPNDDTLPNRWWLKPLIALIALAAVVFVAPKLYRRIEPDRLARRAREYVAKEDYRNAMLTLARALEINPTNQSAVRAMAEITEKLQAPQAVDWRRLASELNPGGAEDALAWANAALRQGRAPVARVALDAMPKTGRETAAYHTASGGLAISEGRWQDAAKEYAEAAKLDPQSELHRYNLATIQLQSPDAGERKAAFTVLETLANAGRLQAFARRALVTRLSGGRQWDAALEHSSALQQLSSATFSDRLAFLGLLHRAGRPELTSALATAQTAAITSPSNVAAMIQWMMSHERASAVAPWIASLDPKLASEPIVLAARSDVLVSLKDWPALQTLADSGSWAGDEFRRFAYQARALRESGNPEGAKTRWKQAITAAARQRESATQLAYLASTWGWKDEMTDVLWAVAAGSEPDWALRMLHGICHAEGETSGLLRIAKRFVEVHPDDRMARNNVAMLSLLLDRDTEQAQFQARELHQQTPHDPAVVSTYAFALHSQGKSADGRAALETLTPEQLRDPAVAAYYAILLASTGATAEARPFFELAKGARLLPEEKRLLEAAAKR